MNFEGAKSWEGQIVDGKFPLRCWLGGSDHSAVFLSEMGASKAVVKLIAADTLDANLQLLRWQEAAQLLHPRLLRLVTEGRCQIARAPLLYLVMEYADENLSEILVQRALTTAETMDLLQSVLEPLAYLHGRGFVHGGVQPSNILATGNQVKLSADRIGASGIAADGARRGDIYDAPEVGTEPRSPAMDVWALGVTIVEALTQHPPEREGSEYQLPRIPAAIPEPFRSIARDCLRRDPTQRGTIADIKSRLDQAPLVPASRPATETRPSRLRVLIPVAAIVLLAAVFLGPKLASHREEPVVENPPKNEQPAITPAPSVVPAPAPTTRPSKSAASTTSAMGVVARQVVPAVPQSARNTIHGKVKVAVRVQVDPSGKVTAATLTSPGPSKYFARLALNAAQGWQFTPPETAGQPVSTCWLLRFQFGRTGTQVFPSQEQK